MNINISVAMATFNGKKFILEQLESIRKQTVLPCELVVCDDGSTDGTIDIIEEFSKTAPFPVRWYLNENNLGYADNFLKCAALCKGDWIAFSDQDDLWLPDKFKKIAQVIQKYAGDELVMIGHTSYIANVNLELTGQKLPNFKDDAYIKKCSNFGFYCIVGFSMVFRSRLIHDIDRTQRPRMHQKNATYPSGHDQWIGMLANALGDIAYINEPLAIWRRHDLSLTTPPRGEGLADAVVKSIRALDSGPYILLANMAQESAISFEKIGEMSAVQEIRIRACTASKNFRRLSNNLKMRAQLYENHRRFTSIKILMHMLKINAYGGAIFHALGWRSFAKDVLVAFGIIGRWNETRECNTENR